MKACAKKKMTKKEAQEHLNYLRKKGNMKNGRIYPCAQCAGFWHITHTDFRVKEERVIRECILVLKEKWERLVQS